MRGWRVPNGNAPKHTPEIRPDDLIYITVEEWFNWVVEDPQGKAMEFAREIGYQIEQRRLSDEGAKVEQAVEPPVAPVASVGVADGGLTADSLHRALSRVLPEYLEFTNVGIFVDVMEAIVAAVCGPKNASPATRTDEGGELSPI
jgi:hypothetical protein